jgi:hypothetical protein
MANSMSESMVIAPSQLQSLNGSCVGLTALDRVGKEPKNHDKPQDEDREAEHPLSGPHPTD